MPLLDIGDPLPDAGRANADGLVAVGGGLSVARLREAYSKGLFPWSADPITWWSPDPRAVFELEPGVHVSRRLGQKIRQQRYEITRDVAFVEVIEGCASARRPDGGTWISRPIVEAYIGLHKAGAAHSVEAWDEHGALVGGVYGVASGGCFSGESMFRRDADASKIALYHLAEHLKARGFALFDAQVLNPFTERMGAVEIPRREFLRRLAAAREIQAKF
ncbi:MAG: leucyl/phenylalanyl-tRNA--protein transferase [Acidobacteria bacterium]|nr:leucyl/phenylalanyl-tRNA--protein transferase [Acidobacteriota bacterium]